MWVKNDQVDVHHRRDRKWGKYARLKPLSVEKFIVHGCEHKNYRKFVCGHLLINVAPYIRDPLYITSMQTRHMVTKST
jgi:hypothetical protein